MFPVTGSKYVKNLPLWPTFENQLYKLGIVRLLLCGLCMVIALSNAAPDSGGHVPLPGPGLSYGGIPYGSVSGNVAEYFKRQAPSGGASAGLAYAADHADQWL
ncbi:hypothetical protein O3G_MSEX011521 [Manduca sexta]|uniref:Uncharacterized protein n=1 Tax=Manduca sexta TaxID=7130 RepID=A0A921ZKG6_MANSE|nr:hypothetical protein O3G_MSEX011521 [Manduca sexta]